MPATTTVGHGRVSYSGGRKIKTKLYQCDTMAEAEGLLPANSTTLVSGWGYLDTYTFEPGTKFILATINFVDTLISASRPKDDGEQEDFCDAGTIERALEDHPSFLMKWTNNLYAQWSSSPPAAPAWWNTATDKTEATGEGWLWSKEDPGDRWILIKARTKKPDTYNYPAPVVTSYYYHRTKSTAEAQLKKVATKQTPPDDFGYTGLEWLVMDSTLRSDGRTYVVVTRYQGGPTVDTDIYA
jgi:hypothetical protein